MARALLPLTLGLLLSQPVYAQLAPPGEVPTEADMLLLEVAVEDQATVGTLVAYQGSDDVMLPLGELSRLLTIAISTDPEQGTASGFVLKQDRTFSLDVTKATVWLGGHAQAIDAGQVQVQTNDIFVPSRLLSRWLPVDLEVDMSRLSLTVRPREQLPLQFRLEREQQAERLGRGGDEESEPRYPHHAIPYRPFRMPFIDQTLNLELQGGDRHSDVSGRYSAYATGDLLGLEGALYVNVGSGQHTNDVRLTLGRNDPDAGLLGALHARTALVGSVPVPAVENISRTSASGEGVVISNRPLSQPTGLGQHSLQGPLPPGWDVELYFNDVLVGLQSATSDGRYHFDDQPLVFGANEFRLVFHGPLGQVRTETETFLLEQSMVPAGEFYYHVAHQRDDEGYMRGSSQFDWGFTDHLAASAGVVNIPVAGEAEQYTHLGLQAHWRAMILSGTMVRSSEGTLGEIRLRTRLGDWSVNAGHARLDGFTSELFPSSADPVNASTRLRIDGAVPLPMTSLRLPIAVEATRKERVSGISDVDVVGRASAYMRGTAMTGQFRWQSFGGQEFSDATLQVSRRVRGIGLRGRADYAIAPERRLTALAISADRRVGQGYLQSLSATRLFGSSETLYTASLTKSLGSFGYGINTSYSTSGQFSIGAQLFLAMGHEPRRSRWLFDAQPMATTGGVSARAFLDDNLNGRMDAGETPIEGVAFNVNGGKHPVETGEDGVAYLARLPVMEHTNIELVPSSLVDPQWVARVPGREVTPRPGAVAEIEFPVITTSEIEGTVYRVDCGHRIGMAALPVEILDLEGNIVATTTTAADGYYVVTRIPAGSYRVRVSPSDGQQAAGRTVSVTTEDWLISGVDIEAD